MKLFDSCGGYEVLLRLILFDQAGCYIELVNVRFCNVISWLGGII